MDKIIVIDDGSTDRTAKIAYDLGVTVLQHSKNMGVGAAMRTGINYAKKIRPDLLVTLDGDGQHNPKEIPRLVNKMRSTGVDIVAGSRILGSNYLHLQ